MFVGGWTFELTERSRFHREELTQLPAELKETGAHRESFVCVSSSWNEVKGDGAPEQIEEVCVFRSDGTRVALEQYHDLAPAKTAWKRRFSSWSIVWKALVVKTNFFFAKVFITGTFVLQGGEPWAILEVSEVETLLIRTSQGTSENWLWAVGCNQSCQRAENNDIKRG